MAAHGKAPSKRSKKSETAEPKARPDRKPRSDKQKTQQMDPERNAPNEPEHPNKDDPEKAQNIRNKSRTPPEDKTSPKTTQQYTSGLTNRFGEELIRTLAQIPQEERESDPVIEYSPENRNKGKIPT